MRADALRHSIGTKIFGAFLAMSLIIASLGAYGYFVLSASENIVANTYDHPMMAINFARAASVDFLQMENRVLRADSASPAARSNEIDALASTLSDDLDVADERSTAPDERFLIKSIRALVREWQDTRHTALARGRRPDLSALSRKILDRFDMLIELNADHGFVGRRQAVTHVQNYEDAVIAVTTIALLLAAAITIFLARRIVRPLSAAAQVADRIAAGELQTVIPPGGRDETGALLNSMQVMQNSIAAQMAREKARAQSAEGRLLDAVESSSEGVVLANCDGRIVVSNSVMLKLFPTLATDIICGRALEPALNLFDAHCNPASETERSLPGMIAGDNKTGPVSTERQLPDGRWLRITASRTSESGTILFFSDFSEIKAREEKYRAAKLQAEAANAAKSRFLANMSHELRTPLNAIIGFSEIISSEMLGPLGNPSYAEYSGDILKSARDLLGVINSVLDLAKSETGRIELCRRPVDLTVVLNDCAQDVTKGCEGAGLSFAISCPDEQVLVDGDDARLHQVFLHLLSNAIKFTKSGGAVQIVASANSQFVEVEIRDSGIGMSQEDIETALTPFAQVDNRLARRYEGSGLGLPLAKAFVESHGGTLSIDSTRGRGTVVTVRFERLASRQERHRAVG